MAWSDRRVERERERESERTPDRIMRSIFVYESLRRNGDYNNNACGWTIVQL